MPSVPRATSISLQPAVVNLALYGHDGEAGVLTVRDRTNGATVNLSDRTWTARWGRWRGDPHSIALDVDATAAASGVLVVHFTAAAKATMTAKGFWDLAGQQLGADPSTLLTGDVTIEPRVAS